MLGESKFCGEKRDPWHAGDFSFLSLLLLFPTERYRILFHLSKVLLLPHAIDPHDVAVLMVTRLQFTPIYGNFITNL